MDDEQRRDLRRASISSRPSGPVAPKAGRRTGRFRTGVRRGGTLADARERIAVGFAFRDIHPITVQTRYPSVRDEATVRVAHSTDLEHARRVGLHGLQRSEGVLADPAPQVLVEELAGRTIDLRLLFWTSPGQADVRRTRDEVLRTVWVAYRDAGIEMPTDILQLEGSQSLSDSLTAARVQATP